MMNGLLTLSIESAILGGSCSIANGIEIIDDIRGYGGVSRAEDILADIDTLLRQNSIAPTGLSNIIVSAGPGSFTGIRIGIASARGFAAGLGISPIQISLFEAMAIQSELDVPTVTAVPAGRGMAQVTVTRLSEESIEYVAAPTAVLLSEFLQAPEFAAIERLTVFAGHFEDDLLDTFPGVINAIQRSPAATLISAVVDARVQRDVDTIFISKQ